MDVPGATRSGLRRPPLVGPWLLKLAMTLGSAPFRELWLAPTVIQFFAAASAPICPRSEVSSECMPSFPAQKHMTISECSQTNLSISAEAAVYSICRNMIAWLWSSSVRLRCSQEFECTRAFSEYAGAKRSLRSRGGCRGGLHCSRCLGSQMLWTMSFACGAVPMTRSPLLVCPFPTAEPQT